jgi:alpha-1,6-mannosyltransferase
MGSKTLHLTNFYHRTSGGIGTFYRALMQQAEVLGRQICLIAPGERTEVEQYNSAARIYYVQARPSPIADRRYRLLWAWGRSGKEIRRILRAEQPDVVEVSDKYTLPYLAGLLRQCWISGIPRPALVATSHERFDDNLNSRYSLRAAGNLFSKLYMRQLYFPLFDWHIANSEYTEGELLPAAVGHRLYRPIRVLPMGVDCELFNENARTPAARSMLAHRSGCRPEQHMLLYAGRLSAEKNLDLLPALAGMLPEHFVLVVAGEGDLHSTLNAKLGHRARFIGHIHDRSELAQVYAGADMFIHPNPREPFGIAPLEAMAAGLPVAVPLSGGVLSYASPENSWMAPATPEAFSRMIKAAFSDEQERRKRAAAARKAAEAFDWKKVAARYFNLFDEIAGAKLFACSSKSCTNR